VGLVAKGTRVLGPDQGAPVGAQRGAMTTGKGFKRLVRERAARTGESYTAARRALLAQRREDTVETAELVEVTLEGVGLGEVGAAHHFLDLKERDGDRRLPVFVGPPEAGAIAFALEGRVARRPMTHDALKQTLDALGGRLVRIVVSHSPETSTFAADVVVEVGGGEVHLDWRVSDAVAVAVRCDPRPPILAPASLLGPAPAGS
jgi:bifunctional DNase/RNase